jgi:hypothetical protein
MKFNKISNQGLNCEERYFNSALKMQKVNTINISSANKPQEMKNVKYKKLKFLL